MQHLRTSLTALLCCAPLSLGPLAVAAQDVRLDVSGGGDSLRQTLRAASLLVSTQQSDTAAAQDYVAAARADYRRLLTGLYSEGYYSGTISITVDGTEASQIDPLLPRNTVQNVVVTVNSGPQFTFGRADIAPLASGTTLPEAFGAGQTARASVIGDAARAAVNEWRAAGRPLASVADQSITARHTANQLDAVVALAPGPELTFGAITVEGNAAVRRERILAIAGIPARTYDPALIARAEQNLRRTGAFSSAAILEGTAADGTTLPLTISVVEQTPRRIGAGAEFSSVSGLTLSGYWLHRNLLGGAERFRVDGKITGLTGGLTDDGDGIDYSLGATFLRPSFFRQDTDFYSEASVEQLDEPAFFQRDLRIEAGNIRRINGDVVLEYGLGYSTGEVSDSLGTRTYSLFYLPLEGTIDRRDNAFDAKSGYYANLQIAPFLGQNGTDSGARITGDGRIYRSFGEDARVTLAARGQLGAVLGANAANIPSSYLFYSGGGGTVRGQAYQSLGVDLGGGNRIGGATFAGAQLEARVGVTDKIGIVGFYDTGFISADEFTLADGEVHAGAGLGVRYNTGIGPIRLDVAVPTSGTRAGNAFEVYIGIGQAF